MKFFGKNRGKLKIELYLIPNGTLGQGGLLGTIYGPYVPSPGQTIYYDGAEYTAGQMLAVPMIFGTRLILFVERSQSGASKAMEAYRRWRESLSAAVDRETFKAATTNNLPDKTAEMQAGGNPQTTVEILKKLKGDIERLITESSKRVGLPISVTVENRYMELIDGTEWHTGLSVETKVIIDSNMKIDPK